MLKVMQKAVELALEGDRAMIKLLLELHVSKQAADDREATDKVSIHISALPPPVEPLKTVSPVRKDASIITDAEIITP
jgi:hypothetical protein